MIAKRYEITRRNAAVAVAIFSVLVGIVGSGVAADYHADRFLVCFRAEVGKIDPRVEEGVVTTGLASFDALASTYGVCRLERWLAGVRQGYHHDDIYLAQIYRAWFARNDVDVEEVTRAFSQDQHLVYAEPEGVLRICYEPNDPKYSQEWHLTQIDADMAWDFWTSRGKIPGDTTVVIGIVDSGVEWIHQDLLANIWQNLREDADGDGHTIEFVEGEWVLDPGDINGVDDDDWDGNPDTFIDDLIGWDFGGATSGFDEDNDPRGAPEPGPNEGFMHGTHVGGIVSAVTDNGEGVASVGWQVKIMPVKCQRDDNDNDLAIVDGYSGIIYAAQAGADIINLSWGGSGGASGCATVSVAADSFGAIVVAAAGNEGTSEAHYPSACPDAVSVASTTYGDFKAYFSNYGSTVDVCAPGENIWSTVYPDVHGGYDRWPGTSMSAPIVAGALGLMKSMFPDSSNHWLTTKLMETCDEVDSVNPSYAGMLGHGRINLHRALASSLFPQLSYVSYLLLEAEGDGDGVVEPGETGRLVVSVRNKEEWLKARGVTAALRTTDPRIEITDSLGAYNDIPSGSIGLNLCDPFSLMVLEEVDTLTDMELTLEANREGDWPYEEQLHFGVNFESVEDEGEGVMPKEWLLVQNYPNPFNPSTEIQYVLPSDGWAHLEVYDLLGRAVATLVNERKSAGYHHVVWEAGGMASGLYFCRLQAGEYTAVKKMVLAR